MNALVNALIRRADAHLAEKWRVAIAIVYFSAKIISLSDGNDEAMVAFERPSCLSLQRPRLSTQVRV